MINVFFVKKWFLDLCLHSHSKKIEMCNAWLHLLNSGIIKMGFGFMHVLASEEKSNSLSQLEIVCSLNICLQLLLFCANLFLSAFLFFFCFLWWREGRRVERLWGRLRRRLFNMSKFALEYILCFFCFPFFLLFQRGVYFVLRGGCFFVAIG